MIVKEKFDLLKNVDNILRMAPSTISRYTVDNGPRRVFVMIELMKNRISHYTKDKVFNKLTNLNERKYLHVVNMPNYPLPITYNIPTESMVINVSPFGVEDIETTKPGTFNLYALMVYGLVFSELISGKVKITDKYSEVISGYLLSVLIRLFGKQYGLLGSFSTEIPKMKFLTNLYVLTGFFGKTGPAAYRKASTASAFNYKDIESDLKKYNFENISDFIQSLSDFGVMPNINKHVFAAKLLRFFGLNVMPAFEDCSRFIATIATSDIKGSNVISTYLSKYNEREFSKILEISKVIFKRR
ncbi:MAG: hypothetical protein DRI84_04330 [Bacteroidetes bacterium]|nr:MAG: hypothetical protein DRI84_04330 [Bacteroidota bacterium]